MGPAGFESLRYRPDIDGLRAVAVAVVILYHAKVPAFAGGYVGVDVFFVISGYLITQLLVASEHLAPRARLADFYLRRARRILPALLVVTAIVTTVACWLLLPRDLVRLAAYVGATPLFVTNLIALIHGTYFDSMLPPVALNHYWSIAVEEQFYLLYPAVLLLAKRYLPQHRLRLLTAAAMVSFAMCVYGSQYKPVATYYLASMRAWELLLGAIVALRPPGTGRSLPLPAVEALAVAAVVTIGLAVGLYDSQIDFPGVYALAPCGATAVLLAADAKGPTVVGRLLSWRVLVFTGLVSYSLYLWHLPVLAFFRYFSIREPGTQELLLLIGATYLLACLTWKYIETPVRSRRVLASGRAFVRLAVGANLLLLGIAFGLWRGGGFPQRFADEVLAISDANVPLHPDAQRCMTVGRPGSGPLKLCRFGPSAGTLPKALVWGDSHALALLPAYERLAWSNRVQLYLATYSACGPLLGVGDARMHRIGQNNCADFNEAVVEAVRTIAPQLVILGGYWSYMEAGLEPMPGFDSAPREALFREGFMRTLQRISAPGRSICAVLGVPTMRQGVPYAMAMQMRRGLTTDLIGVTRSAALDEYGGVEDEIRALEHRGLLEIADPKDALCASGRCEFQDGGRPLYSDSTHLSVAGALRVAGAIEPCFAHVSGR